MKRCCGGAHSPIRISSPSQGAGLHVAGKEDSLKASEQGECVSHLNRSWNRVVWAQWVTDSTNVHEPTMFPERLLSTDESLFDTLSFGYYDIIFRVLWPFLIVSLAARAPYVFDLHTLEHARGQHSDLSSSLEILSLGDLIHPPGFNTINFDDCRMHLCSLDLAQL